MLEVFQSKTYTAWFDGLRDRAAQVRIDLQVRRLSLGNPGKAKRLGGGISELKIDYGPGYRVYFTQVGNTTVLLLAGGDKRTQDTDIKRARAIAKDWR